MKKRYPVYVAKMLAGFVTFVVSGILGSTYIYTGKYLEAVFLWCIAIVFLVIGLNYSCIITIDHTGVSKSLCGKTIRHLSWSEIREVGVTGTKVFGDEKKNHGTLFIYFSPVALTEEERFSMALNWPPRKQIYLEYDQARIQFIQQLWANRIESYRTGELHFS